MREDQQYTLSELCEAFEVSPSGYYAARSASEGHRAQEEKLIVKEMKEIHKGYTTCYGSPRMADELTARGFPCSENRAARIMSKYGIKARSKTAFRPKTTIPDPARAPAPNLLADRPAPTGPGQVYISDITYVATREGWLYLAVVIDLFSRRVAGWKLADHMRTSIVTSAFSKATAKIQPQANAIFHSDRGCQYTSTSVANQIGIRGFVQSMSAKGYCYDNATCESFFATLKREAFPDDQCFETREQARLTIFEYLETFYNTRRRHSSLENISPDEYLIRHFQNTKPELN